MYRYEILPADGGARTAYGMLCKERRDGGWHTSAVVSPFSCQRETVVRLTELCTALQPSPEQLLTVVEAFVYHSE